MEMSHQGGAEAESLLRPEQRNATITPHNSSRHYGWSMADGEPEKAPFLHNEPVRLTPAWEGSNLPNDTLNLKGVAMELAPPRDKYNLIFMTLLLHGLGTLVPWNMFITAKDYFVMYKLSTAPYYSGQFLAYLGFASQMPNLIFSWFNVFVQFGGDLTTRIVWSLSIEVLIFVVTIILAMVDSTQWPELFFWLTIGTVIILNVFNAVFQNTVYGVAARLPAKYTGAVVLGSNISGTLAVLLDWVSWSVTNSVRTAAIYYFIGGLLILLVCFDTYFALPLNRFYRYHDTLQQRTMRLNPALASTQQNAQNTPRRPPYLTIIRQTWMQLFNVFFIFFVSLAVFPAVHSDVKPSEEGFLGDHFTRVTCFLTFNFMAMIGNITASSVSWPGPKLLMVFTILRIAFMPFFLLCNYQPTNVTRILPVLVKNDWVYWTMSALLGWSSGHGSSLGMMYVSRTVAPENAATAGMMGAASLVTGLVAGISFSRVCPIIVASEIWRTLS